VHYDSVQIPMGDRTLIDKLLSHRKEDDKIFVKYKNMSFCHCEWIDQSVIIAQKSGKTRLKRFMEKGIYDQWSGTFLLAKTFSDDDAFNPSFLLIDRIIDEGEILEDQVFFLVKWRAQTYDLSTWESEATVNELDPDKIAEFHRRRTVSAAKYMSLDQGLDRPSLKSWKKIGKGMEYANGNQLRSYQLEALNWLLYCYSGRQNSILADEMGLGKTIQSTSFLNHLYYPLNVTGPFLIVTPLSTIGNWEREIRTWTDMNVVVYHGRDVARNLIVETEFYYRDGSGKALPDIFKFDIVLTVCGG
jgi:SNF2 family DNA or RNA helicase